MTKGCKDSVDVDSRSTTSVSSEDASLDSPVATVSDASPSSSGAKATSLDSDFEPMEALDPNLWYIHGNSYDLTQFVAKHPGGQMAILGGKGRDCTNLFESYHPWSDKHRKVLKAYGAAPPPPDPFYEEIKAGMRAKFPGGAGSTKMRGCSKVCLWSLWAVMMWLFYYVRTPLSCAVAGAIMATIGTRMAHEGAHMQVSTQEWENRLTQFCGYFLTGPSMAWFYRHTVSHHAHTNQPHDVDVEWIWMADNVMPRWFKFIAVLFLPVGALLEIGMRFLFVDLLLTRKVGNNLIVDRWLGKAVPEALFWLVFNWFLGPSTICYLLMWWVAGFIFVPLSQVAHVIVYPDNRKYDSWAKMQIAESVDFASDSDFWWHMAFGLTQQVEHHLFPGLGHHCYQELREVVREVCKKHDVPYYDITIEKAMTCLWHRWIDGRPMPLA